MAAHLQAGGSPSGSFIRDWRRPRAGLVVSMPLRAMLADENNVRCCEILAS